jgi:hypothetical protein
MIVKQRAAFAIATFLALAGCHGSTVGQKVGNGIDRTASAVGNGLDRAGHAVGHGLSRAGHAISSKFETSNEN